MTKTLQELLDIAVELGVRNQVKPTGRGGEIAKRDVLKVLAFKNLELKFGSLDKVPTCYKFRLSAETPQLSAQYSTLKDKEKEAIWSSSDWWLTEKENGLRMWLLYHPAEGFFMFSRGISEVYFLPIEYGDKVLNAPKPGDYDSPFVVDVELKSTNPYLTTYLRDKKGVDTQTELQAIQAVMAMNVEDSLEIQRTQHLDEPLLEFKVIDVIYYKGKDYTKKQYKERELLFDTAIADLRSLGLNAKRIKICKEVDKKKAFHEAILASGGEGTVATNIKADCHFSPNRKKDHFVKIKRSVGGAVAGASMDDTIDAFITGYELGDEEKSWAGMIGVLIVSVLLQTATGEVEHIIGKVANIPLSKRKLMSKANPLTGAIELDPEWYGKVVEVNGQSISARQRRLNNCRILNWRDDKTKWDCTLDEDFLNSQIL